jgi:hypothetical protein
MLIVLCLQAGWTPLQHRQVKMTPKQMKQGLIHLTGFVSKAFHGENPSHTNVG